MTIEEVLKAGLLKGKLADDGTAVVTPGAVYGCTMCGKPYLQGFFSGYHDPVCPVCDDTHKDCARIACVKCKVVVCRVDPSLTDSGYYVKPRELLHIDRCNHCYKPKNTEERWTSVVLEIDAWEKQHGRKRIIFHG